MNEPDADGLIFRTATGRAKFFATESNADHLLAMISTLAAELTVLRARLDTHERLAGERGVFDRDAVENYAPNSDALAQRQLDTQAIVERVFEPLRAELAVLASDPSTQSALVNGVLAATKGNNV